MTDKAELYYVYSPLKGKPNLPHATYETALNEAKRLAEKEKCYFEVLRIVSMVEPITEYRVTEFKEQQNDR